MLHKKNKQIKAAKNCKKNRAWFTLRYFLVIFLPLGLLASSCIENNVKRKPATEETEDTQNTETTNLTTKKDDSVADDTGNPGIPKISSIQYIKAQEYFKVWFDADHKDIYESCPVSNSSISCHCVFSWTELNEKGYTTVTVPRKVRTTINVIQEAYVECNAPSVYQSQIIDKTAIKLEIAKADTGSVISSSHTFFKANEDEPPDQSDLIDNEGIPFFNIHRYTCHELFYRGSQITSFISPQSKAGADPPVTAKIAKATNFCIQTSAGIVGGTPDENCIGIANEASPSAQTYYYNFYVRKGLQGGWVFENNQFSCPHIDRNLDGVSGVWPYDTSFALAISPTKDYTIGIEARSRLVGAGSDSTSDYCSQRNSADTNDTTDGTTTTGGDARQNAVATSCLGFAAKPNTDGTCNPIVNQYGSPVKTYRLRRYYAIFPPAFEATGKIYPGRGQPSDVIYVLDREVNTGSSVSDSYPPTVKGPKPCPFAFLDDEVTTKHTSSPMTRYLSTNNLLWEGVNPDGAQFPFEDVFDTGRSHQTSCAATLPYYYNNKFYLSTVGKSFINPYYVNTVGSKTDYYIYSETVKKRAYIRPIKPWYPRYVEDTNFKACAPKSHKATINQIQASDGTIKQYTTATPRIVDPPLHVYKKDSNDFRYCAKVYPTYNGDKNIGTTDPAATHRIAVKDMNPKAKGSYPLLAPTRELVGDTGNSDYDCTSAGSCDNLLGGIEKALSESELYKCDFTSDSINNRDTYSYTPSSGCCGTGFSPSTATGKHVESSGGATPCTPSY